MNKYNHSLDAPVSMGHEKIRVYLEEENSHNNTWVFTSYFCIGRNKSADVCIKDQSVSRLHAVVYFTKGKWWILDMSSLNGTIVDGKKILRHPLGSQTQLRLGWDGPRLNLSKVRNNFKQKSNGNLEEATQISSTTVRVLLSEGLDDQKEWNFTRHFSIGRHTGADIRINDSSVSRFHSIVHFKEGKWWIQDMNSANGTFVNDQKIFKQQLGFKTQLLLGRGGPKLDIYLEKMNATNCASSQQDLRHSGNQEYTVIREIDYDLKKPAGFPEQKEFSGYAKAPLKKWKEESLHIAHIIKTQLNKHRKYLIVVAPIILIGLVLAGYGYLQENRSHHMDSQKQLIEKTPGDNEKVSSALPESIKNEMKIDDASTHKEPDKTIGAVENINKEMNRERNDIVLSQTSDIYFNAAKKFSKNRYWEVALEYFQNVSKINPDYPELDTEIARMQFEITNHARYEEGVAYIKDGQYQNGIDRLKNIHENSVYCDEAGQRIAKAIKKQEQQKIAEVQAAEYKKAKSAIALALQYYADGKIKSSLKQLDKALETRSQANPELKSRANILRKRISYSRTLYYKGNEQYENGQHDMAMNTWKQFLKMDQKLLSGKNGYFTKSVRQKMADEYCSKAFKAHSEGDWPSVQQYNKMALNLNANHAKSLQIKKMLLEKSKQLFQEGYILEEYNPEKAMEKWKQILRICTPEDEYYKKALMKINTR